MERQGQGEDVDARLQAEQHEHQGVVDTNASGLKDAELNERPSEGFVGVAQFNHRNDGVVRTDENERPTEQLRRDSLVWVVVNGTVCESDGEGAKNQVRYRCDRCEGLGRHDLRSM